MDVPHRRRMKDATRQMWYAACRCRRLAKHMGFVRASCGLQTPTAAKQSVRLPHGCRLIRDQTEGPFASDAW
jgi:hypothetical protein